MKTKSKLEAQKEYANWRCEVYDKYNGLKRTNVTHSITMLKNVKKPQKYSPVNECKRNVECKTIWGKQGYILRHIRLAILRHNWSLLRRLVLALSENKNYYCYVKELTFHLALMVGAENQNILDKLKMCFGIRTRTQARYDNPYDIWYIEKNQH